MAVAGYNIAFKFGDDECTLCGRTQDDLTIAARTKESLTKDDGGSAQVSIVGHDITFRATGIIVIDENDDYDGERFDRDAIIAFALSVGSWNFVYVTDGGDSYEGECVATNYTESSNSSDDATYTIDFRVTGEMTKVTP